MSTGHRATAVLSTVGTVVGSAMLIRSIVYEFVPDEARDYLTSSLRFISQHFSRQFTIKIEEFRGFSPNQVFEAATVYLETISVASARRAKVGKDENEKSIVVGADADEEVEDVFENNVKVKWRSVHTKVDASGWRNYHHHTQSNNGDLNASLRSEVRSYELSFHRKHKDVVLGRYLPYIMERSREMKEARKAVNLHVSTRYGVPWDLSATVQHPMSFETLALDPELKTTLLEDLDNFVAGKDYYQKIGRAWKRGYLLYGPPGTGKSSLIAAIANHLNFDIYDLDLSSVNDNSHLKVLMLGMSNRSMLVVEDIDCSIGIQNRQLQDDDQGGDKVTLSGLLNFVDGLWSCCKEARIIVFTTNHPERLDPALLRPGRMDVHICLSYCTVAVFRQLAANYLGLPSHALFEEIEPLVEVAKVTPAEVGGELMKHRDPEASIRGLIDFLTNKIKMQKEHQ